MRVQKYSDRGRNILEVRDKAIYNRKKFTKNEAARAEKYYLEKRYEILHEDEHGIDAIVHVPRSGDFKVHITLPVMRDDYKTCVIQFNHVNEEGCSCTCKKGTPYETKWFGEIYHFSNFCVHQAVITFYAIFGDPDNYQHILDWEEIWSARLSTKEGLNRVFELARPSDVRQILTWISIGYYNEDPEFYTNYAVKLLKKANFTYEQTKEELQRLGYKIHTYGNFYYRDFLIKHNDPDLIKYYEDIITKCARLRMTKKEENNLISSLKAAYEQFGTDEGYKTSLISMIISFSINNDSYDYLLDELKKISKDNWPEIKKLATNYVQNNYLDWLQPSIDLSMFD